LPATFFRGNAAANSFETGSEEALQKAELPAAQGRTVILGASKASKMEEGNNLTFCLPNS
jgi:hypothetical protein